ncbi:hypothetical protein HEAR1024 [Herminiimonas arsenicoxydans]|uniref:Uncharacterized protein n=1 Tax=Herminiimonas arsenicoxydans TaxID=204773 RepID=A4G3W9_HERAR|nr:hypothetical protein HEAR1024 [Herminiimonas arsenicoxydans]
MRNDGQAERIDLHEMLLMIYDRMMIGNVNALAIPRLTYCMLPEYGQKGWPLICRRRK